MRSALHAGFAAGLDSHGDRVAVAGQLTYRQLAQRADDVGAALGTERRLVLLRARNDVDSLVAYLGALRAGHVVLVGDDEQYDPDVVIDGGHIAERRSGTAHDLHPDLALLLSTSGSTGSPKLVRLSHRNLDANAAAIAEYLELGADDRAITSLPMHYCYGLSVINSHLAAGAGLVLTGLSVVDRCFWDTFRAHEATSLAGVPYTFEMLDRVGFDGMHLPSLRVVTQAGGRLAPERVQRFAALGERKGWRFFVMYGQAEATARMAYLPPELATSYPDCIGVPVPGGSFEIAADGELVYRGPNVMMGYASQPADLALGATVDALHTGDLARRTPEGLYQVVGRRGRFVKLFGLRIDLDHLERTLGVVCAGNDERLVLAGDAAAVCERTGLPLSAVHVVDDVPRLANGKPDYAAMLATSVAAARPTTVADLFAAVLGCDEVHEDDTFVSLGGDSLSYVEASVALEELLGGLPPHWHITPVNRLRAGPPRRTPRVEANVVVRAVAIVFIVGSHARLFSLEGGAHALLAVAGFNFARFQLESGRMLRSIVRIVVPSVAWIAVLASASDKFDLPDVLLVNGYFGNPRVHWAFWYIEALVQILLVAAAVFAVPRVRALARARPVEVAWVVLAVTLAARLLPHMGMRIYRPHYVAWLFALGWVAAVATTWRQRLALSAVAVAGTAGFFFTLRREVVVLAFLLVLIWVASIPVPAPLNRAVAAVAGASLAIYLTHWVVYPPLGRTFGPLVATSAAVAVGVALRTARRRFN
ncbi:MAG TPA: AMP-binding protein [Acidimicrobiales bacterium]|nr:AMP-binding protein [Acidimicrobiales bacterium]